MTQYNQVVDQEQTYQALDQRLQAEVNADQVEIQQLQDRLKVTVLNEILFPEGGWELNQKGRETLNKIVPVLKNLTNQRIEVNGYTDNVPIGPELKSRFPSNWELSTARATDVVLVTAFVPASIAISGTNFTSDLVYDTSAADLIDMNKQKMLNMGASDSQVQALLNNRWYSLSVLTSLVGELERLPGVTGVPEVIELAASAGNEEEARFLASSVQMLAWLNVKGTPIGRLAISCGVSSCL